MLYYLSKTRLPRKKAHVIQQLNMCQAFASIGKDVYFIHLSNGNKTVTWDDVAEYYGLSSSFELEAVPARSDGYSFPVPYVPDLDTQLMTYWLLYMYLTEGFDRGDIIFSRNAHPTRFFLRFLGWIGAENRPSVWFEQHQVDRGMDATFYEQLDGVVCISQGQKRRMVETQPVEPEKIFVAHDGVDLESYEGLSTPEAREQLGIDPDERIVMYTGHLYPSKDVETLVRAAADFDAECYIVGGYPEDVSRLKTEVTIPDNVTFTGFVPPGDVPLYQMSADVLVATVADDPEMDFFSPLKLFEYMATGKPFVVSRKPEYEEVVTHGRNGLFVEPESATDLVDSIKRLLSDPELRADLGERAREDVVQYDWTNRAQQILDRIESTSRTDGSTGTTASARQSPFPFSE